MNTNNSQPSAILSEEFKALKSPLQFFGLTLCIVAATVFVVCIILELI